MEPGRRLVIGGLPLVAFAASVTMLVRLWEGDLFRDEVLYAAVAKTIITRGEWLNLYLGGDPYWRKPPLVFWLLALAYRSFGVSVYAAKLFPALFGVLACVVLYGIARRFFAERIALIAAIVLALTPRFVRTATTVRLDSTVTFFALLSLLLYLRAAAGGRWRDFLLGGAAWGLAVMAKGPFGMVGVYVFIVYAAVFRRLDVLRSPRFLASLLVGIAVCLPWHLYELARWGPAFFDVYLHEQIVDRLSGRLWPWDPPESYLIDLVTDDWCWLPFIALGTVLAVRRARRGDRAALFALGWAGAILVLLYASRGRSPRYLLQFYPPAALLAAVALERVLPVAVRERLPRLIVVLFAAVAFVLAVLPLRLHTAGAADVKALGPALDVVMPRTATSVVGYRTASMNVRAAFIFYLNRDLDYVKTLPETPPATLVTAPTHVADLQAVGYAPVYGNERFVILTRSGSSPTAVRNTTTVE